MHDQNIFDIKLKPRNLNTLLITLSLKIQDYSITYTRLVQVVSEEETRERITLINTSPDTQWMMKKQFVKHGRSFFEIYFLIYGRSF